MIYAAAASHPAVLPAVIAAAGAIIASTIAAFVAWQSRAIKILVNGRLDSALQRISQLETELHTAHELIDTAEDIRQVRKELDRRHHDKRR